MNISDQRKLNLLYKLDVIKEFEKINNADKFIKERIKNGAILSELYFIEKEGCIGLKLRDLPKKTRSKIIESILSIIKEDHEDINIKILSELKI
jgi:hypothetical protein